MRLSEGFGDGLWMIQVGLKHNHKDPHERGTEGDFTHIDEEEALRDSGSDWTNVARSQAMPAATGSRRG